MAGLFFYKYRNFPLLFNKQLASNTGINMNFRNEASKSLNRAKKELSNSEENSHIYASLELRMTLEAIVYAEALHYKEELSQEDYKTWQPIKLLTKLVEYDEDAEITSKPLTARQPAKGIYTNNFESLGECRKLTLKQIKAYYHKLGNWLHTPTQEQLEKPNTTSKEKTIETCNELIHILTEILKSPGAHFRFKKITRHICFRCNHTIIKSIYKKPLPLKTNCTNCNAKYEISEDKEAVTWTPELTEIHCANKDCIGVSRLFEIDINEGSSWTCSTCNLSNELVLGVVLSDKNK